MTKNEFEQKCSLLARTPQTRWFDLRFKAFATMIDNASITVKSIKLLGIPTIFGFDGFIFKIENQYFFFLFYAKGTTVECFNVETPSFAYSSILASSIILSSDDDSDRKTFLPLLLAATPYSSPSKLKQRLDEIF